jgi:hypothetical protein
MDRDELELTNAAESQEVRLRRTGDDSWEVGMMPNLDPLSIEVTRQAETFLSGDRIRLPDGREFKRVMTTAEAREAFGLEPKASDAR